jgi:hypothetical protein
LFQSDILFQCIVRFIHIFISSNEEVFLFLFRPQSAKQARNYFAPISNDDNGAEDYSRPFLKGGKKMLNVLTASNDISRMLPKRIQQDKERLYCETLQLKSNLNEMQE